MIVDSALYRDGVRVPLPCDKDDLHQVRAASSAEGEFVWVGMHEPTGDELERVSQAFALHPLAVEDALHAHQRPKLERYDDGMFSSVRTGASCCSCWSSRLRWMR